MASTSSRPLPGVALPEPLRATDGLVKGAPPEDIFTLDTITKRMPKIMDAVMESLPPAIAEEPLLSAIRELQTEMHDGAQLKMLEPTGKWVGADSWNKHLELFISQGQGWHTAPWWVVENYMYKRLLQELARCGSSTYDPFEPQKKQALAAAVDPLEKSIEPLLAMIGKSEETPKGHADRRAALEATLLRSLWGNQADLSLSAGKVESSFGDKGGILSDQQAVALDLLQAASDRSVIIVLDNHGLEVLCDLVLVDSILRLTDVSSVVLHVKDSPVFVSDVTADDIEGILDWLQGHNKELAARLRESLSDGRLVVQSHDFYTSARTFWELPEDLRLAFSEAAAVILKGDANYRRLLGDLHWPYDTDFSDYATSFWPGDGLICLRTMKSGVAIGIPNAEQLKAKAERPSDWLTSGVYGQVLAFKR